MAILVGNQLENALKKVGFESTRVAKKPRHKKFMCHACNSPMKIIEDTNVMVCTNEKCDNRYIFDV